MNDEKIEFGSNLDKAQTSNKKPNRSSIELKNLKDKIASNSEAVLRGSLTLLDGKNPIETYTETAVNLVMNGTSQ